MLNRLENLPGGGSDKQQQAVADLKKLGETLDTGNISAVRQAFVVLKQDLHALYTGGTSNDSSSGAPAASAPEPRGAVLNVYA